MLKGKMVRSLHYSIDCPFSEFGVRNWTGFLPKEGRPLQSHRGSYKRSGHGNVFGDIFGSEESIDNANPAATGSKLRLAGIDRISLE
jgi:hypothetical protein